MIKEIYTTGQVSKLVKVAPRTVSKWFDKGMLKGYRIPGSQDRRIPRTSLIEFLQEHNIPIPGVLVGEARVDKSEIRSERTMEERVVNLRLFANSEAFDSDLIREDCAALIMTCETLLLAARSEV